MASQVPSCPCPFPTSVSTILCIFLPPSHVWSNGGVQVSSTHRVCGKNGKKKKQLPRQSFFAVCNKSLRRRGGDVVCHVCCCCVVIEAEVIASFITRVSPPTVKSCFFGVPPRLVSMASLFRLFVCLFPSLGGEGWSSECLPSSARKGKATRQCRGVANGSLLFRLVVC